MDLSSMCVHNMALLEKPRVKTLVSIFQHLRLNHTAPNEAALLLHRCCFILLCFFFLSHGCNIT